VFPGSSPITFTSPSSKAHQKSGSFAPPALPGLTAHTTLSDSRQSRRLVSNVEAATLAYDGPPPITRTTFPTCRAHYPGGSSGCSCRLLPRSCSLPHIPRRVGIRIVTFEACSGFTRVTARRIAQPPLRRPLSRGSDPSGCPAEPLVSYRTYRQLSGWNLPPLMVRAFGAHGVSRTSRGYHRRTDFEPDRTSPGARRDRLIQDISGLPQGLGGPSTAT
jgi:hypothetical protein